MGLESPSHWLIVAVVVVVLFGYKKLPDVSRSVGRSLRIFKTEMKGMNEDDTARDTDAVNAVPVKPVSAPEPPPATAAPAASTAVPSTIVPGTVVSSAGTAAAPVGTTATAPAANTVVPPHAATADAEPTTTQQMGV